MASKSESDSSNGTSADASERQALPFEPSPNRKSGSKKTGKAAKPSAPAAKAIKSEQVNRNSKPSASAAGGIPDVISRRMVKRMAIFSGIPTLLGMSTFVVSYLIVSRDWFELPTYAVLLVSLGWFGLGVLGLSYGALSASWDEETSGSRFGWSEFTTNWTRMTAAWRSTKKP